MLDLLQTSETVSGHTIRVWTGVATDEGVGLISMVEVSDDGGRPLCRFEEFLPATVQHTDPVWPNDDLAASRLLQERALERARGALNAATLGDIHGHQYEVPPP